MKKVGLKPTAGLVCALIIAVAMFFSATAVFAAPNTGNKARIPNYLYWPTKRGAQVIGYHGYEWKFGKGCDGQWKRHVGIDIKVGAGQPVYAPEYGHVKVVQQDSNGWGTFIVLAHSDWSSYLYTTTYHHVTSWVRVGTRVSRGQQIGTIYNLTKPGSGPHLHFSIRNADHSVVAIRGALPKTRSCPDFYPQWPEFTKNPLNYTNPNSRWSRAPAARQVGKLVATWAKLKRDEQ